MNIYINYIRSKFNKITIIFVVLFSFSVSSKTFSQSNITFKVTSLKPGDSCTVFVNKNAEEFDYKKIGSNKDSIATHTFNGLSNGKWSVKIDATGYYYPTAKVVELNNNTILVEIKLTPITLANSVNYIYEWKDDSSYLGHAQQSYINDPVSIFILDDTIRLPDNSASVNLFNKYGITLSDKLTQWSAEDAFRLFQTIETVPLFQTYGEGNKVKINSVWKITNDEVIDDISVTISGDIKLVTISRKAFVYANPSVVLVDGVRGKFFSKRLHHAVVAFATNFGFDKDAINRLARERFGFTFMVPGGELSALMKEDASNFQEFSAFEKLTIIGMIEELPVGMRLQTNLKYMVRRIAGQVNPKKPQAAAIAWIGLNTIEFMNGAFQGSSYFDIQRLILHEKSHFLWAGLFDDKLKDDWALLGGWFLDPTSPSGWSTSNTTEFVSAYAHLKDPNEDMAESVAFYVLNPDKLRSRSLKKFEFIRDRIMNGTRYLAMIRKDLTFTVYNLFPDYNYPGKIKRVNVKAEGLPNEDKKVTLEIELNIIDSLKDGATHAYARFTSSAGTFFDIAMNPINSIGSILRGTVTISKFIKSGYWTVNQIAIYDAAWNARFENNSTYGLKLFIDNPKEDLLPPAYKDSTFKLSKGNSKFRILDVLEDTAGIATQYIEAKFDVIEKNDLTYVGANFAIPKVDEKGVKTELQLGVLSPKMLDTTRFKYYFKDVKDTTIKHITYRYPIPDYFPKGFYEITMLYLVDEGENWKRAYFMRDTSNFPIGKFDSLKISKHVRDSIFIETPYPDYIPPVLDVNAITIKATPTRPQAPDGETLFEMEFFAKDSSAYSGKESGVKHGSYMLRDPQGKQQNFSMQGDFGKIAPNFYYLITDPSGNPGIWRKYKVSTILPRGSAPGLWGVESIDLYDRANNVKHYNFVELVRFDLEKDIEGEMVDPKVEILNKKVNARNVDSINMAISCLNCKDKIFRARIYSDMGGNSVVYEGTMTADSITLKNIKLTGVNDGILYATVFMMDSTRKLLGIGKSTYTKDVIAPKSSILKTNLSNFGTSNIDSFIVDMLVSELKGEYNIVLKQSTVTPGGVKNGSEEFTLKAYGVGKASGAGDSVVVRGVMTDTVLKIKNLPIKDFKDGLIEINAIFIDSVGNESQVTKTLIYKDTKDPVVSITKTAANGLTTTISLKVNESVSNTFSSTHLNIKNGIVKSISKSDSKNFILVIDRTCNDTLSIDLQAGILLDTVGNKNSLTSFRSIDTIVPVKPVRSAVNYCVGNTALALTATSSTGAALKWYGTDATGGTGSSAAPTPSTSTAGTMEYYVSQTYSSTNCESQRASLRVTVFAIPPIPVITRDTANNLVASMNGITWYKDDLKISDTTQKIKPTVNGIYSATTTQNGCASAISQGYYYLTTAISNLSIGEYFKIYPNPTSRDLNINYKISSLRNIYISVFDVNGKAVLLNKKVESSSKIDLGEVSKGNYIIQVKDGSGRLITSQKVVKE